MRHGGGKPKRKDGSPNHGDPKENEEPALHNAPALEDEVRNAQPSEMAAERQPGLARADDECPDRLCRHADIPS